MNIIIQGQPAEVINFTSNQSPLHIFMFKVFTIYIKPDLLPTCDPRYFQHRNFSFSVIAVNLLDAYAIAKMRFWKTENHQYGIQSFYDGETKSTTYWYE